MRALILSLMMVTIAYLLIEVLLNVLLAYIGCFQ